MIDVGGMYLLVKPNGHKYWRLDCWIRDKRKTLALGVYPKISLKEVREGRRLAKLCLELNQNPCEICKEEKIIRVISSFEEVAHHWWKHCRDTWTPRHAARVLKQLEDNAFGDLMHLSIDEISPSV